ncbi:uncharacterized protein JN550_012182 [Neoarthrinium moseri]|uniref:uncharacterized protein n=1 Tax=Neoarthrinium moseri TaxID=1658444 RepID=UPI001FDD42F2|nr:uncharacterized protein JN550_012182 [Neoarthrinium moseri]KAI1859169.1 hypothetical protein JN550_012182 [Neoarthrinium moseri]
MALNAHRPASRLASRALRSCTAQSSTAHAPICRPLITVSTSPFSTSTPRGHAAAAEQDAHVPRWARTPERMKATFSPRSTKNPANSVWHVNADPAKLDDALNNLLGKGGERLLPDELKWLAVTHKSFDQGRRGFNDRLAFLGRRIAVVEAMQAILSDPAIAVESSEQIEPDAFAGRRTPFEDKALEAADRLSVLQPDAVFDLTKMQKLAMDTGISEVVRWKPRKVESLAASGIAPVMAGALYAIVGAVAMQHGGKVASRVVRERILRKIKA